MTRPSLALFLATAGLVAGTVGCGQAPEPMKGGEGGGQTTENASPPAAPMQKGADKHADGEGGEGGEG